MLIDPSLLPFVKKASLINSGYARCRLLDHPFIPNGYHLVHRAVWWHITGSAPIGNVVHHKDGNKLNNIAGNLEMQSVAQHQREANKGKPKNNGTRLLGNKNAKRVEPELVKAALEFNQEKHSAYKVGKILGISAQKVYYIWNAYRK